MIPNKRHQPHARAPQRSKPSQRRHQRRHPSAPSLARNQTRSRRVMADPRGAKKRPRSARRKTPFHLVRSLASLGHPSLALNYLMVSKRRPRKKMTQTVSTRLLPIDPLSYVDANNTSYRPCGNDEALFPRERQSIVLAGTMDHGSRGSSDASFPRERWIIVPVGTADHHSRGNGGSSFPRERWIIVPAGTVDHRSRGCSCDPIPLSTFRILSLMLCSFADIESPGDVIPKSAPAAGSINLAIHL